jgi:hypothetical protein
MKLIILPGNSPKNREWGEHMAQFFRGRFSPIYVQEYDHWKNGREVIDLDAELEKLKKSAGQGSYVIFAKSIGSVLAMKGFSEGEIDPAKCVFFGFPLAWCEKNKIPAEYWLRRFERPCLFVQQRDDPYLPAEELRFVLKDDKLSNCVMCEVPGNDHGYRDIKGVQRIITSFLEA